jgi:hypothetical protein
MEMYKRRIVAFILGRIISGKDSSSIYDCDTYSYSNIEGDFVSEKIDVFDSERRRFLSGNKANDNISLFDYLSGKFIEIKINGCGFDGYDYEDSELFNGEVLDDKISIFDYHDSKRYDYTI